MISKAATPRTSGDPITPRAKVPGARAGNRRCARCNRFCRAVGLGGLVSGRDRPTTVCEPRSSLLLYYSPAFSWVIHTSMRLEYEPSLGTASHFCEVVAGYPVVHPHPMRPLREPPGTVQPRSQGLRAGGRGFAVSKRVEAFLVDWIGWVCTRHTAGYEGVLRMAHH